MKHHKVEPYNKYGHTVYYTSPSGFLYRMHIEEYKNRRKKIRHMKKSRSVIRRLGFRLIKLKDLCMSR